MLFRGDYGVAATRCNGTSVARIRGQPIVVPREGRLFIRLQPHVDPRSFLFLRNDDGPRQLLGLRILAVGELNLGHVDPKLMVGSHARLSC